MKNARMKKEWLVPYSVIFMILLINWMDPSFIQAQALKEVPALMVKIAENKPQTLELAKYDVKTRIIGFLAETEVTMTFRNTSQRILEGSLYFPLPEGVSVDGYALDIKGVLVDGVAVEKNRGRQVYEKIIRQGLDPGLVEWTGANSFKTRVYPINPNSTRTIQVRYVQTLEHSASDSAKGGEMQYRLPLKFSAPVDLFTLRIEVVKPSRAPQVVAGALDGLNFQLWEDIYTTRTEKKHFSPQRDLIITLPCMPEDNAVKDVPTRDGTFFSFRDIIDMPEKKMQDIKEKKIQKITVFWDASGSRSGTEPGKQLDILKALCEKNSGETSISLVIMRNAVEPPREFSVKGGDISKLKMFLEHLPYDGATCLNTLKFSEMNESDVVLLFTDGISNYGESLNSEYAPDHAPFYVFSSGSGVDTPRLRRIALQNQGTYFNMEKWSVKDAVEQILTPSLTLLRVTSSHKDEMELYPRTPQTVNGDVIISGCLSKGTEDKDVIIRAEYGYSGKTVETHEFRLKDIKKTYEKSTLVTRLWAQMKLAELVIYAEKNTESILAHGKKFSLVTPETSLLVLETLDQYIEYEVCPPDSMPEMKNEYLRQMDTAEKQRAKKVEDKLVSVVNMWNQRVQWWEKEYKVSRNFKFNEEKKERSSEGIFSDMVDRFFQPSRNSRAPSPIPEDSGVAEESEESELVVAEDNLGMSAGIKESVAGKPGENSLPAADASIIVKPWDPSTPYIKKLQAAGIKEAYDVYLSMRKEYAFSPSFYLECSDYFYQGAERDLALRILSNLAEMELENAQILRVLGRRLLQWNVPEQAVNILERVYEMRPEEPQSVRDLAIALGRRGLENTQDKNRAQDDLRRAMQLYAQIVKQEWDERFPEVEVLALEELNLLAVSAEKLGVTDFPLDKQFKKLLDVDLKIVMTWSADNTDMDLWVTEPSGEKVGYSHNLSVPGGMISRDFTGGYGPEEYLIRRALPGTYTIHTNYYGSNAVEILGCVTLQLDIYTNWGRPNQKCKSVTVDLREKNDWLEIGSVEIKE